jgi:endonuclease YncB( thermonuclease family)
MKDELIRDAVIYRLHDGDTFSATVSLGMGVSLDVGIRIAHIDTPELNTPAGLVSKNRLMELLGMKCDFDKVLVTLKFLKKDKYGRWLCDVYHKDTNISEWLLKEGLGKSYEGGKKE